MREIRDMLNEIVDEPTKKTVLRIYDDIEKELKNKPAAVKYHHSENGGLYRHTKEVMAYALEIYDARPNSYNCTRDDVIVASFVHDFNKIDQYTKAPEWKKLKYGQEFDTVSRIWMNESARTARLCAEYGLLLNDTVMNAVCLHHAAWSVDVSSPYGYVKSEDFTPLAVILCSSDLLSSFILGRKAKDARD